MKLTEQEIEMIETFREWSANRTGIRFTASFVDGVWECTLDNVLAEGDRWRGVGTSFSEAFANLYGNDMEPLEDAAWTQTTK